MEVGLGDIKQEEIREPHESEMEDGFGYIQEQSPNRYARSPIRNLRLVFPSSYTDLLAVLGNKIT